MCYFIKFVIIEVALIYREQPMRKSFFPAPIVTLLSQKCLFSFKKRESSFLLFDNFFTFKLLE